MFSPYSQTDMMRILIMAKQTMYVRFEWDEGLGKDWFNFYNLQTCMFSGGHTNANLIDFQEIRPTIAYEVLTDAADSV